MIFFDYNHKILKFFYQKGQNKSRHLNFRKGLSHLNFIDIVKFVVFNILAPSRKAAKFFKLASGLRLNPA
jgi:hypothetical protein